MSVVGAHRWEDAIVPTSQEHVRIGEEAEQAAWAAPGVTKVNDFITIR